MEEIVGLSAKERARLVEFEQVKAGRQTVVAAAERLSMSGRQGIPARPTPAPQACG